MDSVIRRRRLVATPSLTSAGARVGLFALSASACLIAAAIPGPGVAQASPAPTPIVMAGHAGVPCTGVSDGSLASQFANAARVKTIVKRWDAERNEREDMGFPPEQGSSREA